MSGPDRNGGPSARIFPSSASIAASVSSRSFRPPASKNLIPLSGYGLWLAEIMAPGARPTTQAPARPGVGSTPRLRADPPSAQIPAMSAASSIGPDRRGSRAISNGVPAPSARTAARPSATTSSGVRSTPATPRTPSVPNLSVIARPGPRLLPLRVLRRLAGLLQAVLASLFLTRVAGEESRLLQHRTRLGVQRDERPGDAQPERTGLAA